MNKNSHRIIEVTEEKYDPVTGLKLIKCIDKYGRRVNFLPKKGFTQKFASMSIPLGSIHNRIKLPGKSMALPAGSAHYMEHCVFSKDDTGNLISKLYSKGANANAYTSFDHTMYYFTTTGEEYKEILELYYNAVSNPVLSDERVESERDIILQELSMYEDIPENRIFNAAVSNLYLKHPIKYDIGGSPASVKRIRLEHLNGIKTACYNPFEIVFTLSGDVSEYDLPPFPGMENRNISFSETGKTKKSANANDIAAGDVFSENNASKDIDSGGAVSGNFYFQDTADKDIMSQNTDCNGTASGNNTSKVTASGDRKFSYNEPLEIKRKYEEIFMDVGMESFLIGFKSPVTSNVSSGISKKDYLRRRIGINYILDCIIGESSKAYEELYNEGLINDSFGFSQIDVDGASFIAIEGESPEPEKAGDKVKKIIADALKKGLTDEIKSDFYLKQKSSGGDFVRSLDDVSRLGMLQARADLNGLDVFDYYEVYGDINCEESFENAIKAMDEKYHTQVLVLKKRS